MSIQRYTQNGGLSVTTLINNEMHCLSRFLCLSVGELCDHARLQRGRAVRFCGADRKQTFGGSFHRIHAFWWWVLSSYVFCIINKCNSFTPAILLRWCLHDCDTTVDPRESHCHTITTMADVRPLMTVLERLIWLLGVLLRIVPSWVSMSEWGWHRSWILNSR